MSDNINRSSTCCDGAPDTANLFGVEFVRKELADELAEALELAQARYDSMWWGGSKPKRNVRWETEKIRAALANYRAHKQEQSNP